MGYAIRDAFLALVADRWRADHDFSPELLEAHKVVLHPFSTDSDKTRLLTAWLKRFQPCMFGRISSQNKRIHYCVLGERDLYLSDEELKQKIQGERLLWKQRCVHHETPEDGFLLWAVAPALAYASPNRTLYDLTQLLRKVYVPSGDEDLKGNDIYWETLFLSNPERTRCFRFRFSLDFFAAQGDGRWWHDHRIPGGLGFTANSVGYMVKSREWYAHMSGQETWAVKRAMETVDAAAETPWGKAIYLRELTGKGPFHGGSCPFSEKDKLNPRIAKSDWSHYAGVLSTDHSIRLELFSEDPARPEGLPEWNMDLRYIYDPKEPAYKYFVDGEEVSCDEVYKEIGDPSSRRILAEDGAGQGLLTRQIEELERVWHPDDAVPSDD